MQVNAGFYLLTLLAATGTVLVLYIMRRRVRLGRRTPRF